MRKSLRAVLVLLLAGVTALGAALVSLLWRNEASIAEVGAAVVTTGVALGASYLSLKGSRSRRDRIRRRQVFISYPHENREAARLLAEAVRKNGYEPFLASPEAGEVLGGSVEQQLKRSGVVLMVSPSGSGRGRTRNWVHFEQGVLREARGLQRDEPAVLPVIYSGSDDSEATSSEALDLDRPGWQLVLREHLARVFGEHTNSDSAVISARGGTASAT